MKRAILLGGAALALTSTFVLAQEAPESILPPGFDDPAPAPTPAPAPRPSPGGSPGGASPAPSGGAVVQPLPPAASESEVAAAREALGRLPSLAELERMSTDDLDELFGLKPKTDNPPGARRSMEQVGVLAPTEGGLPTGSLTNQPATLVRAALAGTKGPMVSRWGHILMRRALASRLTAPSIMAPAEFAALRAGVLNRMGEHSAARALVQDIDTANYSPALTNAAVDAYIGTGDLVGACPSVRLGRSERTDPNWKMLAGICNAFAGEETRAQNDLRRALNQGQGERIDVLLAQRFAGAAGRGRRAVTIEWDGVEDMTPWRFALATTLGVEIPERLTDDLGRYYQNVTATAPMVPVGQRASAADIAAADGVLSAQAMVDLYSQIHGAEGTNDDAARTASRLREAYVAVEPAARLDAIRDVWGNGSDNYGRLVLTAYAAARVTPSTDFADDSGRLIASMLTAGLERDALLWADVVDDGSEGWALLALARPGDNVQVSSGDFDSFAGDDNSAGQRKSKMLLAGLAGLGRLDSGDVGSQSADLGINLTQATRWTAMIDRAAEVNNPALVVFLAGLGMQGDDWGKMTPRHLYHIVSALNRVGFKAEARMIAAEAVARG